MFGKGPRSASREGSVADLLDDWPTAGEATTEPFRDEPPAAPVAVREVPRFRERRKQSRGEVPDGTRILIVDDSQTLVAMLRKMLDQNSYETIVAHDAETALASAFDDPPDLIFLDIVLPGMNGFEALRRLRRDPRTKEVPVIMISGNEQAVEQFYAQRIGADDFMKKPFARSEVFARIEGLRDEAGVLHRRTKGKIGAPVTPAAE
ncbi:MAG: response regulator [Xanthomonadales bacterium]|nr:response regulator [Xanthomonadales bacterium]